MDKIPPDFRKKIPPQIAQPLERLEKELDQIAILRLVEEKTKVPKLFFTLGAGFLLLILLIFNIAGELISNIIGVIYSALSSYRELESSGHIDQQRLWLTYWIVFSTLNTIEFFAPVNYIPMYFIIRTIFVIWLYAPQTQGALLIYNKFLKNYFKRAVSEAEKVINSVENIVHEGLNKKDN